MIKFTEKTYSETEEQVIRKISDKFEKEREYNYDISEKIPKDCISITANLSGVKVYLPKDFEYEQYTIEDFVKEMFPYSYAKTSYEGKFTILSLQANFNIKQYEELVKFIIKEGEFCVILKSN